MSDRAPDWQVLIVEDDPTVGNVHCRIVDGVDGFSVIGLARTRAGGLEMIRDLRPDVMLLDFGLPGGDGFALLHHIRATSVPIEVIAVTARGAQEDIRASLHLGVIDYLVKPFEPDRLRRSLHQVRRRLSILNAGMSHQAAVDELQRTAAPIRRWIPKDLDSDRLTQIRSVLGDARGPLTAEQVGSLVSVARVTARRYLEYLVTTEEATWSPLGEGQGRRSKAYRLVQVRAIQDTSVACAEKGRRP